MIGRMVVAHKEDREGIEYLVIFSSLITDEMRIKGKELGADEQMSKHEEIAACIREL